jgi:hypothetical protein
MSALNARTIIVWFAISMAALVSNISMAGPLDGLTDSLKGTAPALTSVVAQKYGLTDDQAAGGIGSILSFAKEKLKTSDYTQLASAVPGAAGYIDKAKSLGAVTGKIGNRQGLNAAFGKLGITPEVGSQLISTVVDYAGKLGGGKGAALLSALK